MTGGWKRAEERENESWPRPLTVLALSDEEKRWDEAMVAWRKARKFQRRARQVTKASGISFERFQVLDVTERLMRQKDDPVSELEVARAAQLAKSTVSVLMQALMQQGLVDIEPDACCASYRIWATEKGERLVTQLRGELLEVARLLAA